MRRLVTAVMVLAALVSWSAAQVRVEKVNYRGWRNTIKISNDGGVCHHRCRSPHR